MTTKKFSLLMISVFAISTSACGAQDVDPQKDDSDKVQYFYAYSHENLRADYDYYNSSKTEDQKYKSRGSTLYFNCLKNENDGAQLILHAVDNVASFDFVVNDDFKDQQGNTISKENISVYGEWYQNVRNSVESASIFKRGYYPDALIPFENFKMRVRNYIDGGRNQGIYVNVFVIFVDSGISTSSPLVSGRDCQLSLAYAETIKSSAPKKPVASATSTFIPVIFLPSKE